MTKPLSADLRERLVAAVEGGQSRRAAAERFGVAPSTAVKWMNRWRLEGHVKPRPMGGDRHSHRIEAHAAVILGLIDEKPDVTLAEIATQVEEARGARFSETAIWRLLRRHGMTYKKRQRMRVSNSDQMS
ncbi:transposase [Roseospira marina]|uniref:Transposase n=1 Tax=Roseospira marina TaxID=140057 RepID=A0A5M6I352_9PROT|nr:winged helix-turn-helix domain-containing protein [Roseospira marina]KAA5602626.1 transposase [Roseospira marina]MBB4316265.1 transposase [Roseospira marina]MBB5089454.1 transposase [Roseospira marina]